MTLNLELKPSNTWKAPEDKYLRRWYGIQTDAAIAAHLGRTAQSVTTRAQSLRVTKAENRARHAADPKPNQPAVRGRPCAMGKVQGLQDIMATATPYGPAPIPAMGATARAIICNSVMRGAPYHCPELRPFDARPGAMDAFALPSRRFDRRVYRDGRVEGVV